MEQATQQIAISDAAQAHFRKLLDTQEEGTNIRIFVVNPGTPNAECGVSYCPPNAKMRKVADDAPLIERVEYVIQTQINPQLASHGGRITLIEITEDGYAILQFGGGCNGCSMVDVTLKDGVEKQLISLFPNELKGAKDVTEHQRGEHSYY